MTISQVQKRYILDILSRALKDLEASWDKPFKSREKVICQVVASTILNLPSE